MRQPLTLLASLLLLGSCLDSGPLPPNDGKLAIGTWGGDGAGVIVTDEQGHVHVGCTFGDMPPNVQLDDAGHFTVTGSYVLRAYPIQQGPSLPASFSGRVSGAVLTLAIAVNDTVEKKVVALGPVTVVFGRTPELGPCPICKVPRPRRP